MATPCIKTIAEKSKVTRNLVQRDSKQETAKGAENAKCLPEEPFVSIRPAIWIQVPQLGIFRFQTIVRIPHCVLGALGGFKQM